MKVLQCEFCGGKLIAKAAGIFECTSCGMLYDKSRIQEMVQEITGTVKVEGVTTTHSLIKRGCIMLEDQKWTDADQLFERALDSDPESAEAYLGKLMAELHLKTEENLLEAFYPFFDMDNWKKAKRFADSSFSARLQKIENQWYTIRQDKEEKRRICEEENSINLEPYRNIFYDKNCPCKINAKIGFEGFRSGSIVALTTSGKILRLPETLKISTPEHSTLSDVFFSSNGAIYQKDSEGNIIDENGNVLMTDIVQLIFGMGWIAGLDLSGKITIHKFAAPETSLKSLYDAEHWENIISIGEVNNRIVGIKNDGTIMPTNSKIAKDISPNISLDSLFGGCKRFECFDGRTVGFREDGTIAVAGVLEKCNEYIRDWKSIKSVAISGLNIFGLRTDGTVLAFDNNKNHQYDVSEWKNIVDIASIGNITIGLRKDGTILSCGNDDFYKIREKVSKWNNIIALRHIRDDLLIGIKCDGKLSFVSTYGNPYLDSLSEMNNWVLFNSLDELRISLKRASQYLEHPQNMEMCENAQGTQDTLTGLRKEKISLLNELDGLTGFQSSKRKGEIENRINEITEELKRESTSILKSGVVAKIKSNQTQQFQKEADLNSLCKELERGRIEVINAYRDMFRKGLKEITCAAKDLNAPDKIRIHYRKHNGGRGYSLFEEGYWLGNCSSDGCRESFRYAQLRDSSGSIFLTKKGALYYLAKVKGFSWSDPTPEDYYVCNCRIVYRKSELGFEGEGKFPEKLLASELDGVVNYIVSNLLSLQPLNINKTTMNEANERKNRIDLLNGQMKEVLTSYFENVLSGKYNYDEPRLWNNYFDC